MSKTSLALIASFAASALGAMAATPLPPTAAPTPVAPTVTTAPAAAAPAAPNLERDIFLVAIDLAAGKAGQPNDVSLRPGYEDQPAFLPDGSALLFVANGEGGNTDVFRHDIKSSTTTQLTATIEAEYSPTPLADGSGFSAIRVEQPNSKDGEAYTESQRLFRYGYDGKPIAPVSPAWKRVGYHAWLDADHLVLFLVGDGPSKLPNTLVYATVADGKQTPLAKGTASALGRSPEGRPTFIDNSIPGAWSVVTLLPGETKPTVVVPTPKVAGESEAQRSREFRWLPDGTLMMGHGNRLLRFDPKQPAAGWTTFAEFPDLPGDISRIAVSADGKQVAFSVLMRTPTTRGIRG